MGLALTGVIGLVLYCRDQALNATSGKIIATSAAVPRVALGGVVVRLDVVPNHVVDEAP